MRLRIATRQGPIRSVSSGIAAGLRCCTVVCPDLRITSPPPSGPGLVDLLPLYAGLPLWFGCLKARRNLTLRPSISLKIAVTR
jgi:hypothetical protein